MKNTVRILRGDHCIQNGMILKLILVLRTEELFPTLMKWLRKCGLKEMGLKGKNSHWYLIFMWILLVWKTITKVLFKNSFLWAFCLFCFVLCTFKKVAASPCLGKADDISHCCDVTECGGHLFQPRLPHRWLQPIIPFPSPSPVSTPLSISLSSLLLNILVIPKALKRDLACNVSAIFDEKADDNLGASERNTVPVKD